jgi:flagellar hook-length control protein FliK
MADSNSLVLLPPRPTAQAPQPQTPSQSTSRATGDDSFEQKLEKAKNHKAHTALKKQAAEEPVKVAPPKPAATKPVAKAPAPAPATTENPTVKKPATPVLKTIDTPEEPAKDAADQQHTATTEAQTPVLEDHEIAAQAAAAKKAAKVVKLANGKSNPSAANPSSTPQAQLAANQKSTADANDAAAQDSNSADAHPVVTAIDSGSQDSASVAEFGTGKIAARTGNQAKTAPSDGSNSAAVTAAAGQAAAAAAASGTDIAAVEAGIDTAVTKIAGKTSIAAAADAPDGSGLFAPSTSAAPLTTAAKAAAAPATPQAQFVEENHPKIITSIAGQLMPHGGTMQLRLDPPDLGALQVTVHLKDGVMTASFETSNDDATKLLSHSLGTLKAGLEAAGVTVDKIHVEQGTKKDTSSDSDSDSKQGSQQQNQAQQDQQRREMVQRMWRKLAGGADPLDLVA